MEEDKIIVDRSYSLASMKNNKATDPKFFDLNEENINKENEKKLMR